MSDRDIPVSGLVLVGYRGTGKSTVGRLLAERLRLVFADADAAIEARAGRSVRAIFQEHGEPFFRDCEERVITELTATPGQVIATGGGAVLRESNRIALRRYGLVVWLTADADELGRRLASDPLNAWGRPSLTSSGTLDEVAKVLDARIPLYKAASHLEVSTAGRSPLEVAETVIARLPARLLDPRGAAL